MAVCIIYQLFFNLIIQQVLIMVGSHELLLFVDKRFLKIKFILALKFVEVT